MRILPQKSFTLKTELTPREVHDVLMSKTEPKKKTDFFFGSSTDKPFRGEVRLFDFEIFTVLQYRNSFNPVVTGTVNPSGGGSEININISLSKSVKIFLLSFFLFAVELIPLVVVTAIMTGEVSVLFAPLPICALVSIVAGLITYLGFRSGAKRAEEEIRSVFNC